MKINKINQGFGIIEVLVSAMLLMIIVGAVIGLGRTSLKNNVLATQRTQAYNLVREKMEQMINQRNENWLNGNLWTTKFIPYTFDDKPIQDGDTLYTYEVNISTLKDDQSDSANQLVADINNNNQYKFANEGLIVNVKVSWNYSGTPYSVSDSVLLTNWKPQL